MRPDAWTPITSVTPERNAAVEREIGATDRDSAGDERAEAEQERDVEGRSTRR